MLHQSFKQIPLGVFLALLLTVPVYAGKNYKISNYGGGHQIWFEAEDYDERNPDTSCVLPGGGPGGRIRQGRLPGPVAPAA